MFMALPLRGEATLFEQYEWIGRPHWASKVDSWGRLQHGLLNLEEKRGGIRRLDSDNSHFQTLIDNLGLIDIETPNGLFTWTNRRSGSQNGCMLPRPFLISETTHVGWDFPGGQYP
jgi:hypothetical protein